MIRKSVYNSPKGVRIHFCNNNRKSVQINQSKLKIFKNSWLWLANSYGTSYFIVTENVCGLPRNPKSKDRHNVVKLEITWS